MKMKWVETDCQFLSVKTPRTAKMKRGLNWFTRKSTKNPENEGEF